MLTWQIPALGEFSALSAAILWALASIAFAEIGRHTSAIHLNLIKGFLASLMMVAVLIIGHLLGSSLSLSTITAISPYGWGLLIISGIIGIGVGDTAYFGCLKRIGPQKGLMLESTAPLFAVLLAMLLYEEYLGPFSWLGILLTTAGTVAVVRFSKGAPHFGNSLTGISLGLGAAFAQATGIVLSRMALDGESIEPLAGGLIRLVAGIAPLLALDLVTSRSDTGFGPLNSLLHLSRKQLLPKLLCAVVGGTFLAIWLQQLAVKHTGAGIAQALLATCPLIGTLLAVRQGYSQPPAVWLGLLCGLAGVGALFLF